MNKSKQLREQKGKIMNQDRKATDLEQLRQDLLGACARGYTHEENSSKELDSDLIKAMVEELMPVFQSNRKAILEEVRRAIGEDEKIITIDDFIVEFDIATENVKKTGKNQLREEMRQKLSILEGETK